MLSYSRSETKKAWKDGLFYGTGMGVGHLKIGLETQKIKIKSFSYIDGYLAKLTHIKRNPEIKMVWNEQEKKYTALPPNYSVIQDIVFTEGKENHLRESTYLKGPENQSLFAFSVSPIFNQSTICFYSYPKSSGDFFVEMDLNDRCVPNHYIGPLSSADIKEIYPHQKRQSAPSKEFFVQKER